MNTREWHDSLWNDAYRRASGDAARVVLVDCMERGQLWVSVSWGKWNGRLCWNGWVGTAPATHIAEDYRVDAERAIAAATSKDGES